MERGLQPASPPKLPWTLKRHKCRAPEIRTPPKKTRRKKSGGRCKMAASRLGQNCRARFLVFVRRHLAGHVFCQQGLQFRLLPGRNGRWRHVNRLQAQRLSGVTLICRRRRFDNRRGGWLDRFDRRFDRFGGRRFDNRRGGRFDGFGRWWFGNRRDSRFDRLGGRFDSRLLISNRALAAARRSARRKGSPR